MFGRKKFKEALVNEVDDSRVIVYDFRRRLKKLFEGYRPTGYRLNPALEEDNMLPKLDEHLDKLFAGSLDDGNGDVLDRLVFGPVREGTPALALQRLNHQDLIARFGARFNSDYSDIQNIQDFHKKKLEKMKVEYELTCHLWDRYQGSKEKVEEEFK